MSDVTVIALGVVALMLAFFFVDATSKARNPVITIIQLAVLLIAALVALITY